jgi:hypothetical protein
VYRWWVFVHILAAFVDLARPRRADRSVGGDVRLAVILWLMVLKPF